MWYLGSSPGQKLAQVLYSRNHDLLRTIGFLTMLMAAPYLQLDDGLGRNGGVNAKSKRPVDDLPSLCPMALTPAELGQKLTTRRSGPRGATLFKLDILVTWWHDFDISIIIRSTYCI